MVNSVVPTVTRTYGHLDYTLQLHASHKPYFGIVLFVKSIVANVLPTSMEVTDTAILSLLLVIYPILLNLCAEKTSALHFGLRLVDLATPAAEENDEHLHLHIVVIPHTNQNSVASNTRTSSACVQMDHC